MYRSFVTCDDPKGVVECGIIRKSKRASLKMEDKFLSSRTKKNPKSNTSLAHKEKKEDMVFREITEEYQSPSSFQLLEVSRGAQKLNQLIDSLSKGLSYDGLSKDIAKELLKGALDLQDSLTMLGKLYEASECMPQLKKNQEKPERRKYDDVGNHRRDSYLSGDQNHQLGFQKPRLSADGSSKDGIEELRNAIRDGFARQNLFLNTSTQERTNSDSPSTSSSQLSVIQSNDTHSSDSPVPQTALQKKVNGPNLIAKLMGLEDIPSKKLMQPPERRLYVEKSLSQRRLTCDIGMPNLRKSQSIIHSERTLKELLENVQSQGFLKSSSAKKLESQSHQSSDFHSKQRSFNNIRPIVLVKPLCVPCVESEWTCASIVWEERALNTKLMPRKMKMKEVFASRSIDNKEEVLNAIKMQCRIEANRTPIKRVIQEGAKDNIEVVVMPEEQELRTKEASNVKMKYRKVEAENAPVKRFSFEDKGKDQNRVVARAEEIEVKKNMKDSSITEGPNFATRRRQKKERTDKELVKVQKVVASSRKPAEKEISKAKIVSRSRNQSKITSTKLRKPENGPVTVNQHISQHQVSTRKTISKLTTQTTYCNSKDQKHNEKQASKHRVAKPITENLECKDHDARIDLIYNDHSEEEGSTITQADQLSIEEEANDSKIQTEEHCGDNQSSLSIITMRTSEYGKNAKSSEEADDQMTSTRTYTNFERACQLKYLLSSSSSFINIARELFRLNMSHPKILQTAVIHNSGETDAKLSLDYANEFIQHKRLPDSQTWFPLLSYMGDSRIQLSLDQLVVEICRGFETLRSYQRPACNCPFTDTLYATLENDMKCKGLVSGIWDLGWRNGFSVEGVEQALNDLEKMVVSELIDEILS